MAVFLPPGLVLLAFALRVTLLGQDSLWFDTAHSAVVASNPGPVEVLKAAAADFQSPLYFLLLHVWLKGGGSDFWLAIPGVIAGTLTVAVAYAVGTRWFSPVAGVAAALFCALTTYQVFYSRYPRGYIFLAFFGLLAAYWLQRAVTEGRARDWALHGVSTTLALYTHPYAFFLLPPMWGYAALTLFLGKARTEARDHSGLHGPVPLSRINVLLPLVSTAAAVGVSYLPWLGASLSQWSGVRTGADAWIEPVSRDTLKVLWDWLWFKTRLEYTPVVDLLLRAGRYLLTGLLLLALWHGRRRPEAWLTAGLVAGPVLLVYVVSVVTVPLWDPRYLVVLSPFFGVWFGYAAAAAAAMMPRWQPRFTPSHAAALTAACLVAMSLPPLSSLYLDPAFRTPDIRAAAAFVRGQFRDGDVVLHVNYQSYLPALWYDHQAGPSGGRFPAPCIWDSLPRSWCNASPLPHAYINLELEDYREAVSGFSRAWLIALHNHNQPGEEAEVQTRVEALNAGRFAAELAARYTGVLVYRLERSP